jgi:galactoside O-acetyltransferase
VSGPTSFYSAAELKGLGLASLGHDVALSRRASIYGAGLIHLGSHSRIDDFVVLSAGDDGEIAIGEYVHIAAHCALFGRGGIVVEDFATVSGRSSIYSVTDDLSGDVLTNPTVPTQYTHAIRSLVTVGRHAVVGSANVILPGVTIGEGVATGAMTLVNRDLNPWAIYVGVPARFLKARSKRLLELEEEVRRAERDAS